MNPATVMHFPGAFLSRSTQRAFPIYADLSPEAPFCVQGILLSLPADHPLPTDALKVRLYGSTDGISWMRAATDTVSCADPGALSRQFPEADRDSVLRPGFAPVLYCALRSALPFRRIRLMIADYPADVPESFPDCLMISAIGTPLPDADCAISRPEQASDPLSALPDWTGTEFGRPIAPADTEEELGRMVSRLLGEAYRSWFRFFLRGELSVSGKDRFRILSENGRVLIEGSSGVAMAAGLNYYLKTFCNVHISQQDSQTAMPRQVVLPPLPVERTACDAIRYAYNYCTLSYTMPFWNRAEWQRELDWLALNGVNLVLDFTGIEAVWVLFLRELGCSDAQIRDWLVSPCHTAWQQMQNIESFGGPLDFCFIADRVRLARENQYQMRLLGMQPVRQGYAGMLPHFCAALLPDLTLFPQGEWNGLARPDMADVSSPAFARLARIFYACQEKIFGDFSHYYAADPYHEGGKRPEALTDGKAAHCIHAAMLEADPAAVWMVQAWQNNPSSAFLAGFDADRRSRHLLILDLSSTDNPGFVKNDFQGTPWIYCMLDMYGGRLSTHGEADVLAAGIPAARKAHPLMRGIGFTAEATRQNPVLFELLFEMAWREDPPSLSRWIRQYAKRRYGFESAALGRAWDILLSTAYRNPGYSHHGGYSQIFCYRPRLSMEYGEVYNELNSATVKKPYYDPKEFYQAVQLFIDCFQEARHSACYLYDLQDLLRQTLNLLGTERAFRALSCYRERDCKGFERESAAFLRLLSACDALMYAREDTRLSDWTGKALREGKRYDDFSADLFCMDAKALITVWAYRDTAAKLSDYAYRQYGGLLSRYYQKRWELWFSRLWKALADGEEAQEISDEEWFALAWDFVLEPEEADENTLSPDRAGLFEQAMETVVNEVSALRGIL